MKTRVLREGRLLTDFTVLPNLNLTNSYTKTSNARSTVLTDGSTGIVTSQSKIWQAQGTASLDVINPAAWAAIGISKAQWNQSAANRQVTASNVLLTLYKAFASTLYAQEEQSVATAIQSIWKTDSEMITLRYDSGRESKGNKMRTDAEFLQSETDLRQASRDLRVAQQNLSQVLGEDQFQALAVTGTWTMGSLPPIPPAIENLIHREPRVAAQQAIVQQNRASLLSARSSLFPTLSLNFTKGYQGTTEFPETPYWTFLGALNFPLFGRGLTSTYFASSAASAALGRAESELRSLQNQVRSDLESAWSGYVQAQEQVRVQAAFLGAARQRRKESDIRYQSGLMPYEQWQLVVVDLVNFEKSFLRSEQNLLLAEAQWRFAAGEQLGEPL